MVLTERIVEQVVCRADDSVGTAVRQTTVAGLGTGGRADPGGGAACFRGHGRLRTKSHGFADQRREGEAIMSKRRYLVRLTTRRDWRRKSHRSVNNPQTP